ncbi:MAG: ABC transporter permease [Candidatus Bathyarchaeia archaeon]
MSEFWRKMRKSRMGVAGFLLVIFFAILAIIGPYISPFNPYSEFVAPRFSPPNSENWFGTDFIGRDVFSQTIYGCRASLIIGFVASLFAVILGALIGITSGFFSGIADAALMRFTDIFLTIPLIPIAIIITYFVGASMWTIILIFGLFAWPSTARQVRSQVLSLKSWPFVEAALAMGASKIRIMFVHILPNVVGIIIANMITSTVFAILMEASLSFLGLGDPTVISWGQMLFYAKASNAFLFGVWWVIIPPGLCIAALACGFSFLGHGINKILNPALR